MSTSIYIAAAQYSTSENTRAANQDKAIHLLDGAAHTADIVLLPAYSFANLSVDQSIAHQAKPVRGALFDAVSQIATVRNSYVCYSMLERDGDKHYVTAVLVGADGRMIGAQRKVSLTEREKMLGLLPGDGIKVFRTPIGNISIPGIEDIMGKGVRSLHGVDTQILLIPAEYETISADNLDVTTSRWEGALRIVAEHGKVCVAAANKIGAAGEGAYIGSSMVIDTSGEIQAIGSVDQEEVVRGNVIIPEQGIMRTPHVA